MDVQDLRYLSVAADVLNLTRAAGKRGGRSVAHTHLSKIRELNSKKSKNGWRNESRAAAVSPRVRTDYAI
jgi:hypothetical protein